MAPKKNDGTEVVVRHGLFRYHVAGVDPYTLDENDKPKKIVLVKHANRGDTITVNDTDYARGMNDGAFFPAGTVLDGGPDPVYVPGEGNSGSNSPKGEPAADTQEDFEFAGKSDDEALEYMMRHDAETILAKASGVDLEVAETVLRLEYARTDGHPNQMLKDQLVDQLGENPEEDEHGNWVNEPAEDDKPPAVQEQAKARKGAGRKATSRSGGRNS